MGSSIEWTDETLNVAVGCTRVSEGCRHCYAERVVHRGMQDAHRGLTVASPDKGPRWNGTVRLVPERLATPLRWRKPRKVFVGSLMDLFHPDIPHEYRAAVFGVFAATQHITYQVLTKRDPRPFFQWLYNRCSTEHGVCPWHVAGHHARQYVDGIGPKHAPITELLNGGYWPLPNVWLGVSCEDQQRADERIPWLLEAPAAVRFVSAEPLLGPLNLTPWLGNAVSRYVEGGGSAPASEGYAVRPGIWWVVVGGESGPKSRPFDLAWARSIRDQCREAGAAFFMKQLGARPQATADPRGLGWTETCELSLRDSKGGDPSEWPEDLRVREFPEVRDA